MNDIYVATDIESNGPSPGHHSMLSFGSVAFTPDKQIHATFTRNLELLQGAGEHLPTMQWWRTQQDAWRACRMNPVPAAKAMEDYLAWLKNLPGRPVFVAHPVAFDYAWISWYLWKFVGEDPYRAPRPRHLLLRKRPPKPPRHPVQQGKHAQTLVRQRLRPQPPGPRRRHGLRQTHLQHPGRTPPGVDLPELGRGGGASLGVGLGARLPAIGRAPFVIPPYGTKARRLLELYAI